MQDIDELKARRAAAARGQALLQQGGDCVETFDEYSTEKIHLTADLILELGQVIGATADRPVIHVGRMAGQFAKPRSTPTEIVGGAELPIYRGDGVHGADPDPEARTAKPLRLLKAHDQAAATLQQLWHRASAGSEPVYVSHPMALRQCNGSLFRLGISLQEAANTAMAAQQLRDAGAAALASEAAAAIYNRDILLRDLQDDPDNNTLFALVRRP